MICPNDITSLKTDINEMIGQKIMIKGSLGRCRTFEKEATIEKAYPNVEFAFGPSYLSKSLKIRHILGIFISLVIDLIFFALGYTQ